ncbi:MAG: hypothetical protein ACTHOE_01830 [Conexibacter sp.]
MTESRARWRIGFTTATAVAALASSVFALAFSLWPGLKPDPKASYEARVSVFAIEPGVTFGAYLHRLAFSPERYRERRDQLLSRGARGAGGAVPLGLMRLRGEVAYIRTSIEGFKRSSVELRWSMYDARSGRRLHGASFGDIPAASVRGDAPSDRTMQQVWIPPPPGPGPYFLRAGIYDARETLLDVADSAPFRER